METKKKPYKYHTIDTIKELAKYIYIKEVQDILNKYAKEEYEENCMKTLDEK
jgi:hypothetical protein